MNDTYITIQGWVGTEVTLRELPGGSQVAQFRMATTARRYKKETGTWEDGTTTWYTVKAWRRLAENVHQSIRSGQAVLVHGRLEADVWEKQDGTVQVSYVVVAGSVGHDLARGTSMFMKSNRAETDQRVDTEPAPEAVEDPSAWQVPNEPAA